MSNEFTPPAQLHIFDPNTLESKLLGQLVGKPIAIQPSNQEAEPPRESYIPKTKTDSYSCEITMNKSTRKSLRNLTRTRPDQAKPEKKHKWRLIKKWFNRYQKTQIIGSISRIETITGFIEAEIVDVKICKDGHRKVAYSYELKPIISNHVNR